MALQDSHVRTASQVATGFIAPAPAAALAATLDSASIPQASDPLPPMWHWLYFRSAAPQAQIGQDGHPKTGGFLPDLGLPRRMAAGGASRFTRRSRSARRSRANRASSPPASTRKAPKAIRTRWCTARAVLA